PLLQQTIFSPEGADGSLYLHVKAVDRLGNVAIASTSGSFLLDNTPPEVRFIPDGNNNVYAKSAATQLQVDGSDENLSNYVMSYLISTEPSADEATGEWQASENGLISIENRTGKYYVHVKVADKAGNETSATSKPFAVDHLPPTGSVSFK